MSAISFVWRGALLFPLLAWSQTNSCDINSDGRINVVDVQLITNMGLGFPGFMCTANVGGLLGCTDSARQVVIKAALGQGCHFIQLTWAASSSAGVSGYNVYRGTSPGGESTTPLNKDGAIADTNFTDTTAMPGMTYYYVVKATNGRVESPPSPEASATAQ